MNLTKLWFCWLGNKQVKLTDETDCIPPDVKVGLRIYFDTFHSPQDFVNILRVEGFKVDTTDVPAIV